MRLDHRSRHGAALVAVAAGLAQGILLTLGWTWKIDVVTGEEHVDALIAAPRPVLFSFWHNSIIPAAPFFYDLHRRGVDLTLLASQSRDGELVTQICKRWGLHAVRGSSSRGGRQALRALHRAVTRGGSSPIIIPDGPRGPAGHFKVGVAVLAQTSRAPILPLGFAARKSWTLQSWDRMIVPRPFSRITVAVGPPQTVPRGLSSEGLQAERSRLQDLLDALVRRAEEAVGG